MDDYGFQTGLYCAAVEQSTGALPVSAALVYLDARQVVPIEPVAAARQALERARAAVERIAAGDFEVEKCPNPENCPLAYACGLA